MSNKALIDVFLSLTAEQQARELARWAHAATVDARDTYIPGTEGVADPARLRRFNEIQHQIAGQLVSATEGRKAEDEGFPAMVAEAVRELRAPALRAAIEKSVEVGAGPRRRRRAG